MLHLGRKKNLDWTMLDLLHLSLSLSLICCSYGHITKAWLVNMSHAVCSCKHMISWPWHFKTPRHVIATRAAWLSLQGQVFWKCVFPFLPNSTTWPTPQSSWSCFLLYVHPYVNFYMVMPVIKLGTLIAQLPSNIIIHLESRFWPPDECQLFNYFWSLPTPKGNIWLYPASAKCFNIFTS